MDVNIAISKVRGEQFQYVTTLFITHANVGVLRVRIRIWLWRRHKHQSNSVDRHKVEPLICSASSPTWCLLVQTYNPRVASRKSSLGLNRLIPQRRVYFGRQSLTGLEGFGYFDGGCAVT